MDFNKILKLKGLKPRNNGHMNFYERCDLTKKVYLAHTGRYRQIVRDESPCIAIHLPGRRVFGRGKSKNFHNFSILIAATNSIGSICIFCYDF